MVFVKSLRGFVPEGGIIKRDKNIILTFSWLKKKKKRPDGSRTASLEKKWPQKIVKFYLSSSQRKQKNRSKS
jgi:hypothetical protein